MGTDKKTHTVYELVRMLKSDDYHFRDQAEEAFKDLGDPQIVDTAVKELISLLEDEEDAFSASAARALASCGLPAVDPLITVLKTGTKRGRMHALLALTLLGNPLAWEPLKELLGNPDRDIREAVVEAMGNQGSIAIPVLIQSMSDPAIGVRMNAADALGNLKAKEAIDVLIAATRDEEFKVREFAAHALGEIGDPKAVDALILLVEDDRPEGRSAAMVALGLIGDPRAIEPLKKISQGAYSVSADRQSADYALKLISEKKNS